MIFFTDIQFSNLNGGIPGAISWGSDGYYLNTDPEGVVASLPDGFNEQSAKTFFAQIIEAPEFDEDECVFYGKIYVFKP